MDRTERVFTYMLVYSTKIIQFITHLSTSIKNVLTKEVRLKVAGNRFYNARGDTSFPIKVVMYTNKSMLGYFDPNFYELGFHECLMHSNQNQLQAVVRHELAHYITFLNHGETVLPHGSEFKMVCQRLGWGEDIYKATFDLDTSKTGCNTHESGIFRKIQKLLALATSSNTHEAELAMIKSQQLLLKHNIDAAFRAEKNDEKVFLKRILHQKKIDAKMRAIANIVATFFVHIVYARSQKYTCLEIVGSSSNIEIAEYVAGVLQYELDTLWNQAQKLSGLRGTIAKNSFFMGLAKGYCNKVQALKREHTHDITNALMVIEKQLVDAKSMVYPRLSSARSSAQHCRESLLLGEKMGKQLNIKTSINTTSKNFESLLA